ncbi:MAG: hypothetical protein U0796_00890 [Gemmatales bacterium]
MTTAATPLSTPRKTHPFWRAFVCLLLGLAAWWGVAWWLEPKPLWRVPLPDKEIQIPVCELPERQQVLVSKFKVGPLDSSGLVLLDLRTGQLLHEIQPVTTLRFDSSIHPRPRWYQGCYYWLSTQGNNLRLWRWQPESGGKEEQVHQWKFHESFCSQVVWPEGSDTFMLVWNWPWEIMASHLQRDPYLRVMMACCVEEAWSIRNWAMHAWKLPEAGQTQLQQVSRHQASHWEMCKPVLSDDGRWLASVRFRDYDRSHARRELSRLGNALVDIAKLEKVLPLARSEIIITPTNAESPIVQHAVEADSLVQDAQWAGPYLFALGWKRKLIKTQPASQLLEQQEHQDVRTTLMEKVHWIFAWDGTTLKPLRLPTRWDPSDWKWHCQSNELVGTSKYAGSGLRSIVVMERYGDMLRVKHMLADFRSDERGAYHAASQQVVTVHGIEPSNWERQVRGWAEKYPWLLSMADLLFPRNRYETAIYDLISQQCVARWHHQYAMNDIGPITPRELSRLYTASYLGTGPENMLLLTLNCYAFPIVMWSPWWSKAAGILVVVVLWIVLTRRVRMLELRTK